MRTRQRTAERRTSGIFAARAPLEWNLLRFSLVGVHQITLFVLDADCIVA